ncbi:MAG: hypothetical protein Q7W05_15180 [Deltaproteobacteria bacterium]|jgi:hypothetical protein|nr:hypothetical protein [Deltaproteobacteria bacterium]
MIDNDNKVYEREKLIIRRLNQMIKMVEELPPQNQLSKLANEDKYIRVCGEKYRGVSLAKKSPLCGYGGQTRQIETILDHFKATPQEIVPATLEKKKERKLQAWLIKEALSNDRQLVDCLHLQEFFDDLFFCLDEVSLGDRNHEPIIRCDILAIGCKDGVYSPVLIELKSVRHLGRLITQLNDFIENINSNPEIHKTALSLMKKSAGIPEDAKLEEGFQKVIVWPKLDTSRKSTAIKLGKDIIEVGYTFENDCWSSFTARKNVS